MTAGEWFFKLGYWNKENKKEDMRYLSLFIALGLTLYLLPILMRLAPRLGLLDQPGGRKDHSGAVPLVGGFAMFLGFVFAILAMQGGFGGLRPLIAGSATLVIVGLLDDMKELSSSSRFVVQIGAALLMVYWGGVRLDDLGYLVSVDNLLELEFWSVPLTVFSVVGVINALNMIDGLDGLAGSISALTVSAMLLLAVVAGEAHYSIVLGTLLMTILAFLVFNMRLPWQPRAKVFMGDAGSMFLGFVLAWCLVDMAQGDQRAMSPAVALWIVGVPLIDTVTLMLRRMLKKRSPFTPDREHFHHILLLAGFGPGSTLAIMVSISATMAAFGLLGHFLEFPEPLMFYLFMLVFVAYFWAISLSWRARRFLRRPIERRVMDRRVADSGSAQTDRYPDGEERRSGKDRREATADGQAGVLNSIAND